MRNPCVCDGTRGPPSHKVVMRDSLAATFISGMLNFSLSLPIAHTFASFAFSGLVVA